MSLQLGSSALSRDLQPTRADADCLSRNPSVSEYHTAESGRSDVAGTSSQLSSERRCDSDAVNPAQYCWVVQHHSASSYDDCWSQPMNLLTEFCQTEDYKSRLAACASSASSENVTSCYGGISTDLVVRSQLPASLELKCLAPHLHRWNPSMSADFSDYFHDRIKVLSTGGTCYR